VQRVSGKSALGMSDLLVVLWVKNYTRLWLYWLLFIRYI